MITSPRLVLRTLTAAEAERTLDNSARSASGERAPDGLASDRPEFADGYPSTFATEVLRLVALYPATDHNIGGGMPDLGPWLIERKSDQAIIGTVSCARTADPSEVTVGYDLAPSCWGDGYATEALTAVVAHLLSVPAVWRVCAETRADHLASRRVMEKSGLRWMRDEVVDHDGRDVKLAHYAIDRPGPL
ncbi:MAG: GNAT family N-acetyltransferase [Pseudonocardia sp.]|nr:GNAT family N-acetyltransferase [Pseudonocardia sp.]MBO0874036.1 GNAT family N-acetyltransferase [Pseudonocardia sp.]